MDHGISFINNLQRRVEGKKPGFGLSPGKMSGEWKMRITNQQQDRSL